jgi:hypothetical protein
MTLIRSRSLGQLALLTAALAVFPACSSAPMPSHQQPPLVEDPPAPTPAGAPVLARIELTAASAMLPSGSTEKLVATGHFDDGTTADVTNLVTWKSSDATLATIDATTAGAATLYATGAGTVSITATIGEINGSATFTITAILRSIVVSPGTTRIAPCGSRQLAAIASFSDGTQHDVTAMADWASSDESVATAGNSDGSRGLVTTTGTGTVTLSARFGGLTGTVTVATDPTVPKSLAVSPTDLTVTAGDVIGFTTTATYCDDSSEDVTMTAIWSSSSPTVANIDDVEDGMYVATATRAGTTFIAAQLDGVSNAIRLDVMPPTLRSIFVTMPTDDTTLVAGSSTQFTANAQYSDGSSGNLSEQVAWSSSDLSVATVSSNGLVTALAPGEVTIMVALDGHFGSLALTVTQ